MWDKKYTILGNHSTITKNRIIAWRLMRGWTCRQNRITGIWHIWEKPAEKDSFKLKKTKRGFNIRVFRDYYRVACSLQKSSLATKNCIWLGCEEANPRVCKPGQGWVPVEMPEGTLCDTRMHLTQEQVKRLLPHLIKFVLTGNI